MLSVTPEGRQPSGPPRCRGGRGPLRADSGLFAMCGEVQVDDLAGHQPISEWHHIGEGTANNSPLGATPNPPTRRLPSARAVSRWRRIRRCV